MFKKELRGCRDGSEEILPAKELQTIDYTEQVFIYVLATPRDIPDLSSPIRGGTNGPLQWKHRLNHWTPEKYQNKHLNT